MKTSCLVPLALAAAALGCAQPERPLALDHTWIVVSTGAPERTVLEEAGFRFAPTVNRHEGQGTASVTIELRNGFLELIYPDPDVPVAPASQAGAEKFRLKSRWRETGYSPIGIVFARTPATPEKLPFPTWRITADWMEPGTFIEMLTPRETPRAVSLSISSHALSSREANERLARDANSEAMFLHPNGARRLSRLRVTAPGADGLPLSSAYVAEQGEVTFGTGPEWLLEVTLDDGGQGRAQDCRPTLPLVVHY